MNTEQFSNDNNEINPLSNLVKKLRRERKNENGEFKPLSLKKAFWVVGALHAIAIGGIVLFSAQSKAKAAQAAEDKKFLESVPKMVGVEYPEPAKVSDKSKQAAKPQASPAPVKQPEKKVEKKVEKKPIVPVITKIPEHQNPNYPQYTKEYVVQQGDTFNGIVKKYKLNATRLKLINGIKDENKLTLGQKLKFM